MKKINKYAPFRIFSWGSAAATSAISTSCSASGFPLIFKLTKELIAAKGRITLIEVKGLSYGMPKRVRVIHTLFR